MQRYTVVLTQEEDGGWSVSVPSLPGCHTEGDTIEEALDMAQDAISLFVDALLDDGMTAPQDTRVLVATVDVGVPALTS